ncbi:3-hydroxyacyl-CoA dehydrogenase [Lysinibacillus yapensis]|uniref:3-hydroxyacyl-CoA dehydrogenase n=1 Tax=Ureibacillus yapensis TaxID=2304605 RepID=A0A396SEB8_9BACL|nr:3-hydroxyacyl-CoA dehydrogenase [Lysinibacillus yapensis]RHW38326.1 3-hydroxyacyl-CoA dehydrogenase [Lysinibacillus yapensis]
MELSNRVALVTGGGSGLGEATVKRIVNNGGKAVILDLQEERSLALVEKVGTENAVFVKTNVTNDEEVQNAINIALNHFQKIDLLINCAGIATPNRVVSRKGAQNLSEFTKVIEVNLIGTFNVIRLAAEAMFSNEPNENGERGVIINTASVAAFDGQIGQAAYSASKGGIVAMTLPIAREFANQGIRVNTIAPGLMKTPLVGTLPDEAIALLESQVPFPSRLGKPEEYAQLVTSLIENPYINGETIRLDGAIRMQPK